MHTHAHLLSLTWPLSDPHKTSPLSATSFQQPKQGCLSRGHLGVSYPLSGELSTDLFCHPAVDECGVLSVSVTQDSGGLAPQGGHFNLLAVIQGCLTFWRCWPTR